VKTGPVPPYIMRVLHAAERLYNRLDNLLVRIGVLKSSDG